MAVKGFMRNMKDTKNAVYDLFVEMDQFEIGKLIGQDSVLGKFSGSVTAKEKGSIMKHDEVILQQLFIHCNTTIIITGMHSLMPF